MKLPTLPRVHRGRSVEASGPVGVTGAVRLDRRTKNLTKRLRPGEIAVIDHVDLDRVSAEALVACAPAAVFNLAPSTSGRYPNLGPAILVEAGVPLVDVRVAPGPDGAPADGSPAGGPWLDGSPAGLETDGDAPVPPARRDPARLAQLRFREGEPLTAVGGSLRRGGDVLLAGVLLTPELVAEATEAARSGLSAQLEAFAGNTMEYLRQERELLLDGVGVPDVSTRLDGRQALIVVRGYHYREDLATLRPYIREYRPVLIGVDGGADALVEAGYRPDMVIGDMDSVSDAALRCGAELVVHAYRDGRAPGLARLEALGLPAVVFPATGTSEDVAMLLADDKGADLIVVVGGHANLVEFLDKGRAGMASTFLTRLRVGGKLVDAKGVSRLYRSRISTGSLVLLVVAALVTLLVAVLISPVGRAYLEIVEDTASDVLFWIRGLL